MNLTRAQKARLGAFVLTGIVVLLGAVVSVAGLTVFERRDFYTVRFTEDVGGLERSAAVKYHGLRVGRIEKIAIAADDPQAIEVTLALEPETVLYEGTQAMLDMSGITGLKSVNLVGGDPRAAKLVPGARLSPGQSMMDRITGQANDIAIKIERVANQLVLWTNDDNRQRVERLVEQSTGLATELQRFLAANREPLKDALTGVTQASTAVVGFTGEGEASVKVVREQILATLEETRTTLKTLRRPLEKVEPEQVAATINSVRRASDSLDQRLSQQELGKTLTDTQAALGHVTKLLEELDLTVRSGREDFTTTLSYLRQAAEDIREFSRLISQDPSLLIRGKE